MAYGNNYTRGEHNTDGKMKILFYDIETFPTILTRWNLWSQGGGYDNVVHDWSIICAAYKWQHEKKVHIISVRDDKEKFKADLRDDSHVTHELAKVIELADVCVAHNGDKFDWKKLQTRILLNGGLPLPKLRKYDTLKVAKRCFSFTSNRLDALGEMLGCGRKIHTEYDLWLRCLRGDLKAFKDMETYCGQDVNVLEGVYDELKAWDLQHPNKNWFQGTTKACRVCGSTNMVRRGYFHTSVTTMRRFKCKEPTCGAWSSHPYRRDPDSAMMR